MKRRYDIYQDVCNTFADIVSHDHKQFRWMMANKEDIIRIVRAAKFHGTPDDIILKRELQRVQRELGKEFPFMAEHARDIYRSQSMSVHGAILELSNIMLSGSFSDEKTCRATAYRIIVIELDFLYDLFFLTEFEEEDRRKDAA